MGKSGESIVEISKLLHAYYPSMQTGIYDNSCNINQVTANNEPRAAIRAKPMLSDVMHSKNHTKCSSYYKSKTNQSHNPNLNTEVGELMMRPFARIRNILTQMSTTSAMSMIMFFADCENTDRNAVLRKQAADANAAVNHDDDGI